MSLGVVALRCQPVTLNHQRAALSRQSIALGHQPIAFGRQPVAFGQQPIAFGPQRRIGCRATQFIDGRPKLIDPTLRIDFDNAPRTIKNIRRSRECRSQILVLDSEVIPIQSIKKHVGISTPCQ